MSQEPKRPEPDMVGDERAQLTGFLDFLRATVVWKASGLTDEQARQALLPSKVFTIAGIVNHLFLVEEYWFGVILNGEKDRWKEKLDVDPDAEFREALDKPLARIIEDYEKECRRCSEIVAKLDFDQEVPYRDKRVNVRWVVTHMIEETGRHAGHLDLLRELTDGLTGE
ncbi:DinB family protein [Amycolatopsis sp. cg5]|uniref:DinB family protein n=1 Tax=Amycolatopsis sp. cg5 TaxID=3238802 RepID=UPI0035233B47